MLFDFVLRFLGDISSKFNGFLFKDKLSFFLDFWVFLMMDLIVMCFFILVCFIFLVCLGGGMFVMVSSVVIDGGMVFGECLFLGWCDVELCFWLLWW